MGERGQNGFHSRWFTVDGSVNSNDERLDGLGHQVDTAQEKIDGHLSLIAFISYGQPCIKSITIACGDSVVPGNAYIKISHKQMRPEYWSIGADPALDCIYFSDHGATNTLREMHLDPKIFNCQSNERQCIKSHLTVY